MLGFLLLASAFALDPDALSQRYRSCPRQPAPSQRGPRAARAAKRASTSRARSPATAGSATHPARSLYASLRARMPRMSSRAVVGGACALCGHVHIARLVIATSRTTFTCFPWNYHQGYHQGNIHRILGVICAVCGQVHADRACHVLRPVRRQNVHYRRHGQQLRVGRRGRW